MLGHTRGCGRPTAVSPVPTLYLKGYDDESSLAVKRKSPAKRSAPLGGKKSKIVSLEGR